MRQGGAAVELLPYSARDPGSILTMGAVCTEFARSPRDLGGFSPGAPVSSLHAKGTQVCGFKVRQERFNWNQRGNFFTQRVVGVWNT